MTSTASCSSVRSVSLKESWQERTNPSVPLQSPCKPNQAAAVLGSGVPDGKSTAAKSQSVTTTLANPFAQALT